MHRFASPEAFYGDRQPLTADQRKTAPEHVRDNATSTLGTLRKWSPEADFGVMWKGATPSPTYRLTLVAYTGELYLLKYGNGGHQLDVELDGGFAVVKPSWGDGSVEVIGSAPVVTDEATVFSGRWHELADQVLTGWAEECPLTGSLGWLRRQLAANNALVQ